MNAVGSTQRLELRQGPALTLTPELLQSIGLLQLSHLELCALVEAELERNPLLRQAEVDAAPPVSSPASTPAASQADGTGRLFPFVPARRREAAMAKGAGSSGGSIPGEAREDLEAVAAQPLSLAAHLDAQLALATADPVLRAIGHDLVHSLDEAGYLRDETDAVARRLGRPLADVEAALSVVQGLDPPGIGARSLSECLALQLRERGRLDRPMEILLARLDLVAKGDLAALARLCGLGEVELRARLAEIRRLDPKPGLAFSSAAIDLLVPDVLVREDPAGGLAVELNPETLPRLLVDRSYYARVRPAARSEADRAFLTECLRSAHWLARSLDRRADTVLKVAAAIVRHQEAFIRQGADHLRPLTLRAIAEEVGLHESTISRVVANKALGTPRGTLALKLLFGAALTGTSGEAHAARAVQERIRRLVAAEEPGQALSDGDIARKLDEAGIRVARRTVAKYRETLRIPPVSRRRRPI